MARPVFRNVHIIGNTSSSTEAFARRTSEISKFVSGIGRQNLELERGISKATRLTLIKTHPTERETLREGNITRHTIPLLETIHTANPNNIYRNARTLGDLRSAFGNLIEEMALILKDADVVLLGGTYFVPWCLLQAAREARKPLVLCYAGILSKEITHLPIRMQETLKLMEQDFYDPKIFYIFPSMLTKGVVEGIFGKKVRSCEVVYNGVPLEFLSLLGPSKKEFPVAFIGRNTPVKNPEFLLGLAEALDRRHALYMVTKTDPANRLIRELKAQGVIVLDPMGTDDLARFYSSCGVVVSPSRFETYGNVPLEAISTGTPALISSSMGVGEVFGMLGLSAYIDRFEDAQLIAGRIGRMIEGNERVGEDVRSKIREKLSWPAVISRYLEICLMQANQAS